MGSSLLWHYEMLQAHLLYFLQLDLQFCAFFFFFLILVFIPSIVFLSVAQDFVVLL